ncbi:hypothetical protein ALC62_15771 [Cyphomyrmex costatus]|uniref:Uncharacterized protein n=1 Tax=Cyphomyrmex costatus TaxID=456900 RepID=A0A151I6A3_9HYME|nr:hypothetical protein ALC62_15771 [Cyphomyrmex costatus]
MHATVIHLELLRDEIAGWRITHSRLFRFRKKSLQRGDRVGEAYLLQIRSACALAFHE